jgi:hypothetical protein
LADPHSGVHYKVFLTSDGDAVIVDLATDTVVHTIYGPMDDQAWDRVRTYLANINGLPDGRSAPTDRNVS